MLTDALCPLSAAALLSDPLDSVLAPLDIATMSWSALSGTPYKKISASRIYSFRSWTKTWRRGSIGTQNCTFGSDSPLSPRDKAAHDHCLVNECSRQFAIFICCIALFFGDFCSAGSCRLYLSVRSSLMHQAAVHDARRCFTTLVTRPKRPPTCGPIRRYSDNATRRVQFRKEPVSH